MSPARFQVCAELSDHEMLYSERITHGIHKSFNSLKDEYDFLIRWLAHNGFNHVFIANLTRVGIDIPVVKVIVPGLLSPATQRMPSPDRPYASRIHSDVTNSRFPNYSHQT